ncbi:MAG: aminotransferase class III-fold pyridoxal phosphate-dependent enzyme [Cellulomonas sp.]|nr:aminotransferase class III-fold pyridoxal phosphate-dependent enzyme [Cellulomonas sp.]
MGAVLDLIGIPVDLPDVVHAHGCTLTTADGRTLLDWEAGVWCLPLGHSHPEVAAAVQQSLSTVGHVGYRYSSPVVDRALRGLCEVLGMPNGRALLLTSGSEAVDLAVRTAAAVTGRDGFIRQTGHYLSASGGAGVPAWGRWTTTDELDALGPDERREHLAGVAAIVLEPGNASGLVQLPDGPRLRTLVAQVRQAGGLVVVDEVTTGFGRTGRWFGFEHDEITPDLVAVGKGCGNGFPVAALAVTAQVAERAVAVGFRHAQSHQNDVLGAHVLATVLDVMTRDALVERSARAGERLRAGLEQVAARTGRLHRVRGRGLLCAVDVADGTSAAQLQTDLRAVGHLVGAHDGRGVIRLYPPLVVTDEQIDALLSDLAAVLVR